MSRKSSRNERWISQQEADRLNAAVCELFLSGQEEDACAAIEQVILNERMELVEGGGDDDQVELYRMPSGKLVVVWWESNFGTSVDLTTKEEWDQAAVGFDVDTGVLWTSLGRS